MIFKLVLGILLTGIISYLLGSISFPIIWSKLIMKTDVRTVGSKNAGLSNTIRCFGMRVGILTLIGDLAKGVIAVLLCKNVLFNQLNVGLDNFKIIENPANENTMFVAYTAGFFAILGHMFPIYFDFKGGKGILTTAAIVLTVDFRVAIMLISFWILMVFVSNYISVASITAISFYPILTFLSERTWQEFKLAQAILDTGIVVLTSLLIVYMHKSNIQRLKNGTENKFNRKRSGGVNQ
jgi:glycerol-3-phosphate acyltransferase PlsY